MAKNIMKARKKKKDSQNDSGAKVWPAPKGAEEEKDDGNDDADSGKAIVQHQSKMHLARDVGYGLADAGIVITFAEAVQNSSTLYGVSSLSTFAPRTPPPRLHSKT